MSSSRPRVPTPDARWWIVWWTGVAIVPISGIIVIAAAKTCTGFFPVGTSADHGCRSPVTALVWGLWLIAFACMTIPLTRFDNLRLRTVVIVQLIAGIAFLATPMQPTADPYLYHLYGLIGAHWDPWHPVAIVSDRPAIAAGLQLWHNPPIASAYGPLVAWYEHGLLALLPGLGADQLVVVERGVALAAALAVTVLLRGPRIAMWALHPLVLYEFALAAHCDVLMLVLLALSIRLRNAVFAGIAIGLSGMVKVVGLGAVAFRWAAIPSAVLTVAVFALADPRFLSLTALYGAVYGFSGSPELVVAVFAKSLFHARAPELIARILVIAAVVACAIALRVQRRSAPAYAVLLVLAASSWIVPWYLTWALFAARYAHRPTAIAISTIAAGAMILEAPNEVSAHGVELLSALAFLLFAGLALVRAWLRGESPRPAWFPAPTGVVRWRRGTP